ncbi:MAG: hypothetical protein JWQ04_417 [Pedosphaera sp.]|nr:hypothetical protein [Pedosphaera sp.]
MKSAIPWVLVVALLGGDYFLFSAGKEKDAELAKLRQDSLELTGLRAENAELKKIPLQTEELERLRKDHDELLRVRNEVQRMRDQLKQLTTQLAAAKTQTMQAQQAQQQAAQLANEAQALSSQQAEQTAAYKNSQAQATLCINNLRQIEAAKQQWALENKKPADAVPTPEDLTPYLANPAQIVCPAGGVYTVNAIGVLPACSVPGHSLAQAK